jgi:thiol:disulfide interchange protein
MPHRTRRALRASSLALIVFAAAARGIEIVTPATAPDTASIRIEPITGPQLLERVRASKAGASMVNVWATWCIPCREEFPELLRLRERWASRGLELILVSGDFDATLGEAKKFLAEHGVDFATYLKSGPDAEFIDTLDPAWSGALPATFVFDADGTRRHSLLGKASYETFEEKVRDVLDGKTEVKK